MTCGRTVVTGVRSLDKKRVTKIHCRGRRGIGLLGPLCLRRPTADQGFTRYTGTVPRAKPRPPWGQHFLRDREVLEKIAASLPIEPGSVVIEIGPGRGALTKPLLARGARVIAIEIDPRLVTNLEEKFAGLPEVEIVPANILNIDLAELIESRGEGPVLVAGNLPYYITSPILKKTFAVADRVLQAVFLMQEEVARRVVATKRDADYGFLSVLCQLYSEPEWLFGVPPEVFRPPPKVSSALVRFTLRRDQNVEPGFVEFLQHCFRQPRKTLLNNLSGVYGRSRVAKLAQAEQRSHQLDLEDLRALWKQLESNESAASEGKRASGRAGLS